MAELTPKQLRFVDEYLVDLNATQAAIRAGYSANTAQEQGARLLSNVIVSAAVAERMNERAERTEITQDMVLRRWWQIATADPRKLIEYRRCSCRYCYGKKNQYQWIDEQEFIRAYNAAVALQEAAPDELHDIPDNEGGYGYNPTITPSADCPKCFGRGHGEAYAHDTRNIDDQSAVLYAGVKVTKEGLEVKMHDQTAALENVAKHLGMFVDRKEVGRPGDFERMTDDELEQKLNANESALRTAQAAIRTASSTAGKAAKAKSS
jgi:phage terminase small subunit